MEWLADEFVGLRQQDKIDAPRSHANGFDLLAELPRSQGEAVLDFRPEPQNVPAQRARYLNWPIRETVHLFEADPFAVPEPGHDPAAFSPEVDRQIDLRFHARAAAG